MGGGGSFLGAGGGREHSGGLAGGFAVADRGPLERLTSGPLPFPAAPAGPPQVYRDIYFDTAAAELRRRGAVVGVRLHAEGTLTLAVELRDASGAPARSAMQRAAAGTPQQLFGAPGEAAELLRALVDPARL